MQLIKDKEFGGERPLFASHDLHLDNVTILTAALKGTILSGMCTVSRFRTAILLSAGVLRFGTRII